MFRYSSTAVYVDIMHAISIVLMCPPLPQSSAAFLPPRGMERQAIRSTEKQKYGIFTKHQVKKHHYSLSTLDANLSPQI